MAFRANTHQQISLNDEFNQLSARTRKIVEKSWAKHFADLVFPAIQEERFAVLYSDNPASRSNTPVNFIIGALMLKTMFHLSDDETLESICCDVRFKYALHTTSAKEQPISDRTFSRFRERLYNYQRDTGRDLLAEEMKHLASVYQDYLGLHSDIQRMDSMMVATSAKQMSRLEILYTVNANAVKRLKKQGVEITKELEHYLREEDLNQVIYYCKDDEVAPRLQRVIEEADYLKQAMNREEFQQTSEYQLLLRVLNEQTQVDAQEKRGPREKKEIPTDSLQNPSDPDATFRRKADQSHRGYSGNLVETLGEDGVSLITDFDFQPNKHSDSAFCKEQLNKYTPENAPSTMICDGAFGGLNNHALAEEKNIELVATALTGTPPNPQLVGFLFSEDGKQVQACPQGFAPERGTYSESDGFCRIWMKKEHCLNCSNRTHCRVQETRQNCVLRISKKMVMRAHYLVKLGTERYRELAKMRNAIEGIPSVLRRKYRVDESPLRGKIQTGWLFSLAIGAYNFRKLHRYLPKIQESTRLQTAPC